jgi:sarcosine oxidase / L-pipecolate oxidase
MRSFSKTAFRCGVLSMGQDSVYWKQAYQNDLAVNARIQLYPSADNLEKREIFPAAVPVNPSLQGYINFDGGWVSSGRAVEIMTTRVVELGGRVIGGKVVKELLTHVDGEITRTAGVVCADGSRYDAHTVVIAAGSWMGLFFPFLGLPEGVLTATG